MCVAFKYSVRIYYKLIENYFGRDIIADVWREYATRSFDRSFVHNLYTMHNMQCTLHRLQYIFVIHDYSFQFLSVNRWRRHTCIHQWTWPICLNCSFFSFSFSFYPSFSHLNGNTLKSIQRRQRSSTVYLHFLLDVNFFSSFVIGYSNTNVTNKKNWVTVNIGALDNKVLKKDAKTPKRHRIFPKSF